MNVWVNEFALEELPTRHVSFHERDVYFILYIYVFKYVVYTYI